MVIMNREKKVSIDLKAISIIKHVRLASGWISHKLEGKVKV